MYYYIFKVFSDTVSATGIWRSEDSIFKVKFIFKIQKLKLQTNIIEIKLYGKMRKVLTTSKLNNSVIYALNCAIQRNLSL